MGANCCTSSRNSEQSQRRERQFSMRRNARCSPPWTLPGNNRTHNDDVEVNLPRVPFSSIEFKKKNTVETESQCISSADSRAVLTFQGSKPASNLILPDGGSSCSEATIRSSLTGSQRPTVTTPPSLTFKGESSSSRCSSLPADQPFSLKPRQHPGDNLSSREDKSTLPTDLSGWSPEGWSTRLFSELIASSRQERWSFDSEVSEPGQPDDVTRSNSCGLCAKSTKERSPWSGHKMVPDRGLTVVAVLVCGHVFHAECLENVTSESDKFDPPCPICSEKPVCKAQGKGRIKISRSAVADVDLDWIQVKAQKRRAEEEKQPSAPGSMSRLRRYFTMESRSFWGRPGKEKATRHPR